jgi:transcription elongation factor GreA
MAGNDLLARYKCKERKREMNTQFLTSDGQQQLLSQLEYLRTVKRAEVTQYLREALEAGGVIRNAAYEDTQFERTYLERRIADLEQLLATAQVIDPDKVPTDVASLGSVVHLATSNGHAYRYTIVGSYEADPGAGRISNESPVGKALLGRKAGDQVLVATPGGVKAYTILEIE